MKITAPWGYDAIVPLRKEHRVLLPAGTTPAFCRSLNALAVSFSELGVAARDYPIVFASQDKGKTFAPVAVLGLVKGANLFVNAAGDWDPATYLPAFVRRYPFCISKLYVDGKPSGERVVCVARAYIDAGGVMLFDARGEGTARWKNIERLLTEYEADLDRTAQLCAALARLRLLEAFSMDVVENARRATRLAGMYRVDEKKLAALRPASLKVLVAKGFLPRIYSHLQSLDNFSRLYEREKAARRRQSARA
jgi:hypothetical protein